MRINFSKETVKRLNTELNLSITRTYPKNHISRFTQKRQTATMINPFQYLFRRSHRTTSLLYFRWNHAKVLSTFHLSIGLVGGLPRGGFRLGHERRGIMGAIPRLLSRSLSSRESYPLSACRAAGSFFGLPVLPVRTSIWSMSGSICALSLSAAPVEMTERGFPFLSTSAWMVTPLPLNPYCTSSPPPLPATKKR